MADSTRHIHPGGGRLGLWLAAALLPGVLPTAAAAEKVTTFEEKVQPIFAKHCHGCHGPEKKKGGLDLARFNTTETVLAEFEVWKKVTARINLLEMPPRSQPQLNDNERTQIARWFAKLPRPKRDCDEIASDANLPWYRGFVMSRRLTHAEYDNTIRDLFGVDLRPARSFPADGGGGEGFDTTGSSLFTSPILIEQYLAAADRVISAVLGGLDPGASPELRAAAERLLVARPGPDRAPREAARLTMAAFTRRAFRRPVAGPEVERLLGPFDRAVARGDSFEVAIRLPLKAALISPHFLFLVEPEPDREGVYALSPFQLASRLSYFLWSSLPDPELFQLAEEGRLGDPETLRNQVRRLLHDPRSRALGENFALQWLDLGALGGAARPDPKLYPEFDDALAASMRREVVAFFNDLVAGDGSLVEVIDSRHTFLDRRLAQLYGIGGVEGDETRRVEITDPRRGGLLGMAAVHLVTSHPARTSPVLRGKWVLEALLGTPVPPPPPNVPALVEERQDSGKLPMRQRLAAHRARPECASCHDRMDPLGFGLENFDVLGRWRVEEGGSPVDSRGTLPSGESFASPAELRAVLLKRKDEVLTHLTRKLLGYALGRELNQFDTCAVEDSMKALKENGYRASALFETIALSFPFQHRSAGKK